MENEMIERVARALVLSEFGCDPGTKARDGRPLWEFHVGKARAAIAAMREPTEAMKEAPDNAGIADDDEYSIGEFYAEQIWQAMIDAALAQNPSAFPNPIATP